MPSHHLNSMVIFLARAAFIYEILIPMKSWTSTEFIIYESTWSLSSSNTCAESADFSALENYSTWAHRTPPLSNSMQQDEREKMSVVSNKTSKQTNFRYIQL